MNNILVKCVHKNITWIYLKKTKLTPFKVFCPPLDKPNSSNALGPFSAVVTIM
jgi:hypothetical protein